MADPIYKPLTPGQAAAFGTSGDAVKALQTQLNTTNTGKAGYVPLKVDGLYGPLTQAAAGYKAPAAAAGAATGTPTVPVDTTRYARTPNANDALIEAAQKKITDSYIPEPNKDAIVAEKRKAAELLVDSVRTQFANTLNQEYAAGDARNSRVRALNTSAGLGGSDFASAAATKQEEGNKKAVQLIEQEREAKIQAILADVDDRASEEYRRQREEYVKGLEGNLDALKAAKEEDRTKAMQTITGLAQQGISIDRLKESDPNTYEHLIKEYGGNQLDLESAWNESLPEDKKTKYSDKIIQGANGGATLFRYGLNPVTGKVDQKEYDLGVSFNTLNGVKPVNVNGRLFALSTDADGNEIARPLTDMTSKGGGGSGKTVKSGSAVFTGSQLSAVEQQLQSSKTLYNGDGKYVNPEKYQEAYDAWIEAGGQQKEFLNEFPPAKYVNPENNTLPEYLRSANKTGATTKPKASGTPTNPFAKTPTQ